jgi:hypothetical protein
VIVLAGVFIGLLGTVARGFLMSSALEKAIAMMLLIRPLLRGLDVIAPNDSSHILLEPVILIITLTMVPPYLSC